MVCPFVDCGYCYAIKGVHHNNKQGSCIDPEHCPYKKELERQTTNALRHKL